MAEKGLDTKKGGKKTWKIQEEDILISEWGKYEYLSNTKSDDNNNNNDKKNGSGSYFKSYLGGNGNFVHRLQPQYYYLNFTLF